MKIRSFAYVYIWGVYQYSKRSQIDYYAKGIGTVKYYDGQLTETVAQIKNYTINQKIYLNKSDQWSLFSI